MFGSLSSSSLRLWCIRPITSSWPWAQTSSMRMPTCGTKTWTSLSTMLMPSRQMAAWSTYSILRLPVTSRSCTEPTLHGSMNFKWVRWTHSRSINNCLCVFLFQLLLFYAGLWRQMISSPMQTILMISGPATSPAGRHWNATRGWATAICRLVRGSLWDYRYRFIKAKIPLQFTHSKITNIINWEVI